MKKVVKSPRESYPLVKLYKEDLEEILTELEECGFKEIKIQTDDYEYNSKELEKIKPKIINKLIISAYNPFYIRISFDSQKTNLSIDSDSTIALGLKAKLEDIFRRRTRKVVSLFTKNWVIFSFPFVILVFLAVLAKLKAIDPAHFVENINAIVLLLCLLGLVLIGLWPQDKLYSLIILDSKEKFPNFWKRNSDQIIITSAIAILSFLLGKFSI